MVETPPGVPLPPPPPPKALAPVIYNFPVALSKVTTCCWGDVWLINPFKKSSELPIWLKEPVKTKLPVIKADPVYGKLEPPPPPLPVLTVILNSVALPFVKVIVFKVTEAVTKKLEVWLFWTKLEVWVFWTKELVWELTTKLEVWSFWTKELVWVFWTKLEVWLFWTKELVWLFWTKELVWVFWTKLEVWSFWTKELVWLFRT